MATILRLDMPPPTDGRRWLVGLLVSSRCTEVAAALVGASGCGLEAHVELAGTLSAAISREVATLVSSAGGADSVTAGALSAYRSHLAEVQAALVTDLLASLGIAPSRVLAVGVHDPGIWRFERHKPSGYLGLCDAARLAEATGLNVIDAFPARDLTQGGQGGPITAVAEWLLLKAPRQNRLVLDLGRTVRMTYLPDASRENAVAQVLAFDVGPGTLLLDLFAQRLTGGQDSFDPGGRLAVQGRRIAELVDHWLHNSYFERPLPRWHPRGVPAERFLTEALQLAVRHDWSVRDLLCSATHFVAETVAMALRTCLPEDPAIDEIVVVGGGQYNGMLLREIGRLVQLPLRRIGELWNPTPLAEQGRPKRFPFPGPKDRTVRQSSTESVNVGEVLGPASVAVLAMLYLDQVPANRPAITGTEVPRLLGRLTPGSPQNWQWLLQTSAGAKPGVRTLRVAL